LTVVCAICRVDFKLPIKRIVSSVYPHDIDYVVGFTSILLTFCGILHHWYHTINHYDGGNVKISSDGGESWNLIFPAGGYYVDSILFGNCGISYEPAFSDISGGWQKDCFDLSAYVGQNVMIAFDFGAQGLFHAPGWLINSVNIWSFSPTKFSERNETKGKITLCEAKPNPFQTH